MEELFGDPAYKGFVLQDHKRLPARFFARDFRRADQPTYAEPLSPGRGFRAPVSSPCFISTDLRT